MKRKNMYSVIRNDAQYRQAMIRHGELQKRGIQLETEISQLRGYLNYNQDNRKVMKDYRNLCSEYQSVIMEARMLESKMQQYLMVINTGVNNNAQKRVGFMYKQRF